MAETNSIGLPSRQCGKTNDIIAAIMGASRAFDEHTVDPLPTIILTDVNQVLMLADFWRASLADMTTIGEIIDGGWVVIAGRQRVQWNAAHMRSEIARRRIMGDGNTLNV